MDQVDPRGQEVKKRPELTPLFPGSTLTTRTTPNLFWGTSFPPFAPHWYWECRAPGSWLPVGGLLGHGSMWEALQCTQRHLRPYVDNGWQQHIGVCLLSCRRSDPVAGQPVMLQTDQEGQQQELRTVHDEEGWCDADGEPKNWHGKEGNVHAALNVGDV